MNPFKGRGWFVVFFLASFPVIAKPIFHSEVLKIRKEIRRGGIQAIADRTDVTIGSIVRVASVNLRAKGFAPLADSLTLEWNTFYRGMLSDDVRSRRDIGDHHPLVEWLAAAYDRIESRLGVPLCKLLHISDIKTINFALPVVFRPCSFPMDLVTGTRKDEYRRHFAKGDVYVGLIPVLTWWGISIGCWVATSGIGAFLCSVAATGAEIVMARVVAPALSNRIYYRLCGNQ